LRSGREDFEIQFLVLADGDGDWMRNAVGDSVDFVDIHIVAEVAGHIQPDLVPLS